MLIIISFIPKLRKGHKFIGFIYIYIHVQYTVYIVYTKSEKICENNWLKKIIAN